MADEETVKITSITAHGPKVTARIVAREAMHEQLRLEVEAEQTQRWIESVTTLGIMESRRERAERPYYTRD